MTFSDVAMSKVLYYDEIVWYSRLGAMEIEFYDKSLALVLTDRAMETKLPMAAISSFRKKYKVILAAPDERTLRNWKSLHYEKLKGYADDRRSIRLNNQWRLVFTLSNGSETKMRILAIEDYH